MSASAFRLHAAIQSTVARETEELKDKKKLLENNIQTVQNKAETQAHFALLFNPTSTRQLQHANPNRDEDEPFMIY